MTYKKHFSCVTIFEMASVGEKKGNTVELNTFLKYPNSNLLGYKSLEKEDKKLVNFVWCKLCAKYKNQILAFQMEILRKLHTSLMIMTQTKSHNIVD